MKERHNSLILARYSLEKGHCLALLEKGGVRVEIKVTYVPVGMGLYGGTQYRAGVVDVNGICPGWGGIAGCW